VLVSCWSVKGGVGTTVVAVSMALGAADPARPALLVDLAGDGPSCLGVAEPATPGVAEWLGAEGAAPDALVRLEAPVTRGLHLLHRGVGPLAVERATLLLRLLASSGRTVIVDCGRIDESAAGRRFAAEADRSVLVTRLCMLAARRAAAAPVRPSGIVVVREPGRFLSVKDVEEAVGAPVVADLAVNAAMARAVDAGLVVGRLPRGVAAALGSVAA